MFTKQISASVLFFPLYLGVASLAASAQPVRIDGATSGQNTITGTAWEELEGVDVVTFAGGATCMVVCSAEAENPNNPNNPMEYRLAVTSPLPQVLIGPPPANSERKFQFAAGGLRTNEISSDIAFRVAPFVARRIYCAARKNINGNPNLNIPDSSMVITCAYGTAAMTEIDLNPPLPLLD